MDSKGIISPENAEKIYRDLGVGMFGSEEDIDILYDLLGECMDGAGEEG
jgi:hypothetical protein